MRILPTRPLLIFYILVLYVFASFTWWSYLLLKKNKATFEERVQLEILKKQYGTNALQQIPDYLTTAEGKKLLRQYERQKWMIAGEGLVFMILLVMGSIRLLQTFRKEMRLAQQQSNFLLSVTHELKSPLASVKLSLQTLLRRVQLEAKYKNLIDNSIEDIDRLTTLVDNLLYAARMEDDSFSLHREKTDISDLTRHVIRHITGLAKDGVTVKTCIQDNLVLHTDKMAWSSLVQNLVENAMKYSPPPACIEVHLKKEHGHIVLTVKDNGIGIAPEERANIFKKFYRIGNEETRRTKGTGLGLFIVKKIVELHKGKITLSDNEPKGTIFRIVIPDTE
ncbi:MAG: two-component sensor histidine kinase [Chitinophagales bacterium]|nr:MAG: two-component sensor histidine kinase [Chitinophagales bacterium]